MSNTDAHPDELVCTAGDPDIDVEIITARDVPLGGPRAMTVHRTLPQRRRSLIGAWCFIDHFGPDAVARTGGMDVAPHPHTCLQTVSWLFTGAIRHDDSAGYHELVRPGEVNLMTAGAGICHSEVSTRDTEILHGVQLWTVLPESARHGDRRFDHHVPTPVTFDGGEALVFLGSLLGDHSPVPTFTPLVGAEIRLEPGATVALSVDPTFEHGVLVDTGTVTVGDVTVHRTELAYTGTGATTLHLHNTGGTWARLILLGGEPFTEPLVMWWNFIGRDDAEIRRYREQWNSHDSRFGEVTGYAGHDPDGPDRLPAPAMPATTVRPRTNPAPVARTGADPYRPKERIMTDPTGPTDSTDSSDPTGLTDATGAPVTVHLTTDGDAYGIWLDDRDAPVGHAWFIDHEGDRIFHHTVVDDDFGGRGLAGALVRAALEDTRSRGLTVVPVCPYVRAWIPKHDWDGPVRQATGTDIAVVEEQA